MDTNDRGRFDQPSHDPLHPNTHQQGVHSHGTDRHDATGPTMRATAPEPRRRGMGWVLPVIVLLLIGGLLFATLNRDDVDDDGIADRDAAMVGTSGVSALGAMDPGSDVELQRVQIADVVGDRTFWVGEGKNRALVVIPEDGGGAEGREQRERFRSGQYVSINGSVADRDEKFDDLKETDRAAVSKAEGRVVKASRVQPIESR